MPTHHRQQSTTEDRSAKRLRMSGPVIGTHSGHFHADEALAVHMLRLLPTYHDSPLIRTRDPEKLSTCHTVVDVGGEYEPSRNRYDHHQREFNTTFPGHGTKLSSAGLVYLHFGKAVIAQVTGLDINSEDAEVLYQKLYDDFIEAFDGNDNGISAYDTRALSTAGIKKRFEDRGFSIASVVNRYNHHWSSSEEAQSKEEQQAAEDARFLRASAFTGEQFEQELTDKFRAWLPARAEVRRAFESRQQWDPQGRIMVIPYKKEGVPWADHLYALEAADNVTNNNHAQVLYVLFAENGEPDSKWRIRAVSVEGGGFENRKDLPDAWKGVRDEELDKVSGIKGCVFVHASGFIGGNKTFEGALEMARKAVEA
ncbi:hypothetical protein W97_01896 [Coniosporium apollinis CBS 100218]|uniref:MYG1 protein n=1 Tax=Coniosporium apollinis (strain CBS 100218) TaxID=1168221 RepID=R7YL76_CONA1|nr:uncharacterized protein W97_01896 [Coniosporium apollinis CBS 100218]EON62672.1 hypothetical protein W97_01896 [Coniosporium apollinis CBS 100218]